MIKKIKESYFADKNYGLVYTHHFLHNIATAAMYIFTGAYFLELGMPLHFVLLFYGLEFGVRGFLCPFGLSFLNKVGIIKAQIIAALFLVLFFVGISFSDQNLFIGFFSLFLAAISGAIYYPLMDVFEAIYIKDNHNRAKQLSMSLISGSFGKVFGAAGVGFLLSNFGFDVVLAFITVCLTLAIMPFFWLKAHATHIPTIRPADVYEFLTQNEFKSLWKPFFGEQLTIIVRAVMVPIFIYTIVEELDALGYLIALSIIIEKIITLMAGHYTDELGPKKIIKFSTRTYTLAMLSYIFLAKTPLSVFFVESYHKITLNIYGSSFRSAMHNYAREKYPNKIMLFGASWQMLLCFGELLILPLYGLLAYFIGINVFYVSCVFAVLGIFMVNHYFQREHN